MFPGIAGRKRPGLARHKDFDSGKVEDKQGKEGVDESSESLEGQDASRAADSHSYRHRSEGNLDHCDALFDTLQRDLYALTR